MTWIALLLIVIAGIAEHYKDLSGEGKLKRYWDKNYPPRVKMNGEWFTVKYLYHSMGDDFKITPANNLWWKVHWLQGPKWDWMPVWIRQYLSFRDGWHLLKFISLNSFAVAVVLLAQLPWWWYFIIRTAFSLLKTLLIWKKYIGQ